LRHLTDIGLNKSDGYQKSITIIEDYAKKDELLANNSYLKILILYHLALSYYKIGHLAKVKDLLIKALELYEQQPTQSIFFRGKFITPEKGKILLSLGFVALELEDIKLSFNCFENSRLETDTTIDPNSTIPFSFSDYFNAVKNYGLGIAYKRFAMKPNKRLSSAKQDKALSEEAFKKAENCLDKRLIDLHITEIKQYFQSINQQQNNLSLDEILNRKRNNLVLDAESGLEKRRRELTPGLFGSSLAASFTERQGGFDPRLLAAPRNKASALNTSQRTFAEQQKESERDATTEQAPL